MLHPPCRSLGRGAIWRSKGEVDRAIGEVRDESGWFKLWSTLASREKAQELATTAAERVSRSDTMKKAIEGLVPHDIIYRKKMGFPTPLRQWLMDPRSRHLLDLLRARDGLLAAYIDRTALDDLIDALITEHQASELAAMDEVGDA